MLRAASRLTSLTSRRCFATDAAAAAVAPVAVNANGLVATAADSAMKEKFAGTTVGVVLEKEFGGDADALLQAHKLDAWTFGPVDGKPRRALIYKPAANVTQNFDVQRSWCLQYVVRACRCCLAPTRFTRRASRV
jgi:hypothetical protein